MHVHDIHTGNSLIHHGAARAPSHILQHAVGGYRCAQPFDLGDCSTHVYTMDVPLLPSVDRLKY